MTILDFIMGLMPQDPRLGPPFPKCLNLSWPWMGSEQGFRLLEEPEPALTTYENIEEIELVDIDPELLMPRKIIVHRKSKQLR